MASQSTRRRIIADVRRRIDEYGWSVQAVGTNCSVPGCCGARGGRSTDADFGYTVGLTRFHDHPELIITGVPQMESVHPLNVLGELVRGGRRLCHRDVVDGVAPGCPVQLVRVAPDNSARFLLHANELYRRPGKPPVPALQVVWPDQMHRFPWDSGCMLTNEVQPLLGPVPAA